MARVFVPTEVIAAAELELRRRRRDSETKSAELIPAGMGFRAWCEYLADRGLKVDGRPFRLDNRPAMAWIYDQIPSTPQEAFRRTLVLQKCAQVGFTVMEMLACIYMGLKFQPATIGMFLPDMALAGIKSSERFLPIVRTIPELVPLMGDGEGNVRTRRIGGAMFVFSWTTGRATTESLPMEVLSLDEVQEMTLEQMEKVRERLSASEVRFTLMGSTANWPDADINHWYKRGSQHRFHTECPSCLAKRPLDDTFPHCIKFDPETDSHRYVCSECGGWIDDPQVGEWIPDDPTALEGINPIMSIHFPQFLSPTISPGEILFAYNTATDLKNFYNRKLGKPYLDPSLVPVTMAHLRRCVDAGKAAGVAWKTRSRQSYMGIDQMGQFNVVVVKERLEDGRQAVIHVEAIYGEDPFARCDELMAAYSVAACVVEINPNYNDAKRFAGRHKGRVWICNSFGQIDNDMIVWGDGPKLDTSERRTSEDARDRYTLKMDQYKCMQVSLARFTADPPLCLFPDDQGLVQEVIERGVTKTVAILPVAFEHFCKTALVAEKDEETNKYRRVVRKIGIDPHFSYANMLCDVAWARSHGTAMFMIPTEEKSPVASIANDLPGLPDDVAQVIDNPIPHSETCASCVAFDPERGFCTERRFTVSQNDMACDLYMP